MFIFLLGSLCLEFWIAASTAEKVECPPFPHAVLQNGNISALNGQRLVFRCDSGYFLASPPQVRCWRGKWTSTKKPICIKSGNMCDDPPTVAEGEIHGEERMVGSVVQYMCKPGFLVLGEARRVCMQSGHWSGVTPACMDESEPLQNIAERLKNSFVSDLTSHSLNDSGPEGRLLDKESIHHGLELVILLDRSSSVDPEDFKIGLHFVKFLLQEFGIRNGNNTTGTRAAVMAFGTKVDILFNLDDANITGPTAANEALNTLQAGGGGTAMEAALTNVFTNLSPVREKAKKAIFLITDGEPNIGTPGITPEDVAIQLKDPGGFEIFTMGIGKGINRKLLSTLASEPLLSHVFILDKYSDLRSIMKMIKDSPPKIQPVSPWRCGYIKGESLYLKKWPWLATVYVASPIDGSLGFCAGTLICSQWVLTAATCFHRIQKLNETEESLQALTQAVFVVMGGNFLFREERQQMNFYTLQVILHPNFTSTNELQDNLALLKLNAPVPLKQFRPACLPPTDKTVPLHMDLNINASIAGWGLPTSNVDAINGANIRFSRVTVPAELAEQQECKRITGRHFNHKLLCAGFGNKICAGDMGSPLIALNPSTHLHHVLGVLSGKCKQGFNRYTELTQYIPWINRVTDRCHLQHWMT